VLIPMKLGLIGCGQVASLFHIPAMKEIPGMQIEAIADIDKKRVEKFGSRHRIERRYADHRSMFRECHIDSVLVCTPPKTHAQIILDSIDRNLHVLCEKPFTSNLSEVDTILRLANKNLILFPVHNYVFTPSLWLIEHLIRNRNLGKLEEINAHLSVGFNTWRSVTNYRTLDPAGVVTDLLYHVIYVTQRLYGPDAEFSKVKTGKRNKHTVAEVSVEGWLENDARLRMSASWTTLLPHFKIMLRYPTSSIETDLIWHPYKMFAKGIDKDQMPKPLKGRYAELRSLVSVAHPSFRFLHQDFRNSVMSRSAPQVTVQNARETLQTVETITKMAGM